MGKITRFTDSALHTVRRHFGLDQHALAAWLGLTQPQLSRYESGRRSLPPAAAAALATLEAGLGAEATPAGGAGPPDPAPLLARLRYCRHHARRLQRELAPLEARAIQAARWQAARPAIQAALPPDPGGPEPPDLPPGEARWAAYLTWFRHRWLAQRPGVLTPAQSEGFI
ncbi:helix-turn-helix domain-containing protein [Hymenobacter gummosus]|nr:helix-turn-helix transcriptional regulator [Hymenobacter gummosus]